MFSRFARISVAMLPLVAGAERALAQQTKTVKSTQPAKPAPVPRVVVPTSSRPTAPVRPVAPSVRGLYPWRLHVTVTVFWIGEQPDGRNLVPNCKSSWDQNWMANFGGYDNPDPGARIANHTTGEFRPKAFVPKLNPFYVALPYNDVIGSSAHKPEASRVIPWFTRVRPEPGESVCKGKWVQIYNGSRSCYAQWEDCGPWVTDDWQYVFGNAKPRNSQNGGVGIDISPAVRDYLSLPSGKRVHWRFVEDAEVPYGPWKKYGQTPSVRPQQPVSPGQRPPDDADPEAVRTYLEYLRKQRDEEYLRKPMRNTGP